MPQLDHLTIPCRDRVASARRLAELLGVSWSESGVGPFSPVYLNDRTTIDFDQHDDGDIPILHCCFKVDDAEFDAILGRIRAAGIPFRSAVHGPVDNREGSYNGSRLVYWNEPDGHQWEILTVSYARQPA